MPCRHPHGGAAQRVAGSGLVASPAEMGQGDGGERGLRWVAGQDWMPDMKLYLFNGIYLKF